MHALKKWVGSVLIALLIVAPFSIGLVWRQKSIDRSAKLDQVCVILTAVSADFQTLKDYVALFVTTQQGRDFVAGLPVPPKPDC